MRWPASVVVGIILGAGVPLGLVGAARADEPAVAATEVRAALEVREKAQDGGTIEEGTVAKYRFVVANRGEAELVIQQVRPSCGCSVAHWDRQIAPGKEGVIEAEINTKSLRGRFTKYLAVFSNDPERPQVALAISGEVVPLVKISPSGIGRFAIGDEPVTKEFTLERSGGQPMQVVEVTSPASFVTASAAPLPGQGRYRLSVTVSPEAPVGRRAIPLAVRTDDAKVGTLSLTMIVERGIITMPPSVYWGTVPQVLAEPRKSVLTVTQSSRSFHVTGVTADDPNLQTRLETVRDGHEYRITVTYGGGWEGGSVRKTLTITTDDPKQPVLTVPVQATVQNRPMPAPIPVPIPPSSP